MRDRAPGDRHRVVVGAEIPPLATVAYQRALEERRFSSDSIHDDAYTRAHGYAGALVSAYVLCGYMSQLLVDFFGADWLRDSHIALTFVDGGVQQGDAVTCRGRVTGRTGCDEGVRLDLEIWMEKGPGTRVVLGTASGVLRAPPSGAAGG